MVETDRQDTKDGGQHKHRHQRCQALPRGRLKLTLVEREYREGEADRDRGQRQARYEEKVEAFLGHLVGGLAFGTLVFVRQLDLCAHGHGGQEGADQEGQDRKPGDEEQVKAVCVQDFSLPAAPRFKSR